MSNITSALLRYSGFGAAGVVHRLNWHATPPFCALQGPRSRSIRLPGLASIRLRQLCEPDADRRTSRAATDACRLLPAHQ
jgi:hypothetical protein